LPNERGERVNDNACECALEKRGRINFLAAELAIKKSAYHCVSEYRRMDSEQSIIGRSNEAGGRDAQILQNKCGPRTSHPWADCLRIFFAALPLLAASYATGIFREEASQNRIARVLI